MKSLSTLSIGIFCRTNTLFPHESVLFEKPRSWVFIQENFLEFLLGTCYAELLSVSSKLCELHIQFMACICGSLGVLQFYQINTSTIIQKGFLIIVRTFMVTFYGIFTRCYFKRIPPIIIGHITWISLIMVELSLWHSSYFFHNSNYYINHIIRISPIITWLLLCIPIYFFRKSNYYMGNITTGSYYYRIILILLAL